MHCPGSRQLLQLSRQPSAAGVPSDPAASVQSMSAEQPKPPAGVVQSGSSSHNPCAAGGVIGGGAGGDVVDAGGVGGGTQGQHGSGTPIAQSPSPGWQSTAISEAGQLAPWPLVTIHVRCAAVSHKLVQLLQDPLQSSSGGHFPSPGWQSTAGPAASSQLVPLPLCGTSSVHVRSHACSQRAVQLLHDTTQSTFAGHLPTPAWQPGKPGQGAPLPLCGVISVHVRLQS